MIAAVRRQKIRDIIAEKKSATVVELAKRFQVTEETIRRDLKELEAQGLIMRSYGGAFIQSGVENLVDVDIRTDVYVDSKTTIARRCLRFIRNGDTIFIDNSTTAYHIAKLLGDRRVTVLSNSLLTIDLLADNQNVHLVSIGGDYDPNERAFYGNIAVQSLAGYYVDKAFVSCRSLSLEHGVTDSTDRWTQVRRTAIAHANQVYCIADYSKLGCTSYSHLCGYDQIDYVITDRPQPQEWHDQLAASGCVFIDSDDLAAPSSEDSLRVKQQPKQGQAD